MGNCEFALRVRNRNIIRPPFPEKSIATKRLFFRECPSLYEIENCMPQECEIDTPFINPTRLLRNSKKQNINFQKNINNNKNSIQTETLEKEKENRIKIAGTSLFSTYKTMTIRTKCDILL